MARARRQQFDRPAAVPGAADEAFLLQVGQVLVHRRQRRQAEPPADLLETRRVAVLLDEFLEIVEDLALAFGEWLHGAPPSGGVYLSIRTLREEKAKNQQIAWRAVLSSRRGPILPPCLRLPRGPLISWIWPKQPRPGRRRSRASEADSSISRAADSVARRGNRDGHGGCARLGCRARYIGTVGTDQAGATVKAALRVGRHRRVGCAAGRWSHPVGHHSRRSCRAPYRDCPPRHGALDARRRGRSGSGGLGAVLLLVDAIDPLGVGGRPPRLPKPWELRRWSMSTKPCQTSTRSSGPWTSSWRAGRLRWHTGRSLHRPGAPAADGRVPPSRRGRHARPRGLSGAGGWNRGADPGLRVPVVDPTRRGDAFRGGFPPVGSGSGTPRNWAPFSGMPVPSPV